MFKALFHFESLPINNYPKYKQTKYSNQNHRRTEWLKNKSLPHTAYQRLISAFKTHIDWKQREKDIPFKWKTKESISSYTYIRQIDFESKTITKERRSLYINKLANHKENITIINIYAHNIRAPKYNKQLLTDLNEEIESTQ